MADEYPRPASAPGMPTARMEALSDGMFAIDITLLVLELDVQPVPRKTSWAHWRVSGRPTSPTS